MVNTDTVQSRKMVVHGTTVICYHVSPNRKMGQR